MAKKGVVDEFFDLQKFEKDKKQILDGMAEVASAIASQGKNAKGSTSVSQQTAAQKEQNKLTQQAIDLTAKLSDTEIKEAKAKAEQAYRRKQATAAANDEINSNAKIVGAYKALENEVKKLGNAYKDLAALGQANTKQALEIKKAYDQQRASLVQINQSLGNHRDDVGRYGKALEDIKGKWAMVTAGWAAGVAALSGLAMQMKKAIEGAMEDERAERKLTLALDGNSKAAERLLRFKEQLFKTTLLDESEIMRLINYGLAMGRTEGETKKLVNAAISLSNATGGQLDVMGAMDQLNKTYSGDLGRLKKYTGELTAEQLRNGDAIDIVNGKYKKFLSEGVGTMEGQVTQMKKWWGEAWDTIGMKAMGIIQGLQTGFRTVTAMMGGGNLGRSNAAQKAENTKAEQLRAHQEKMDQLNAEIDNNKRLLGVNLATQKAEQELTDKLKDQTATLGEIVNAWDAYVRSMQAAQGYAKGLKEGTIAGPTLNAGEIQKVTPKESSGVNVSQSSIGTTAPDISEGIANALDTTAADQATEVENERAMWDAKVQLTQQAMSTINSIVDASYQNKINRINEEMAKDEEARELEIKRAGGNSAKIKEINDRYDKKQKEREKEKRRVERESAKYQRTAGIVQAVINTALGVTAALTSPANNAVPGMAAAMAAINLLAGLAEVAIISSQPLPSYKKGRKGGKAELAKVHEGEAIRFPDGRMTLTPPVAETLAYLPAGADVIPNNELLELAGAAANQFKIYDKDTEIASLRAEIRGLHAGFQMLNETVRNKTEHTWIASGGELRHIMKKGNVTEEWVNERVRL